LLAALSDIDDIPGAATGTCPLYKKHAFLQTINAKSGTLMIAVPDTQNPPPHFFMAEEELYIFVWRYDWVSIAVMI
jgi:hypothetical protein